MKSLLQFWNQITSPKITPADPADIPRIQLFASLMLFGLALDVGIGFIRLPVQDSTLVTETVIRIIIGILLFIIYRISRYGYVNELSFALGILGTGLLFGWVIASPTPQQDVVTLNYLITFTFTISLFLSITEVAFILAAQLIGMLVLPLFADVTLDILLMGPITLNLTLGILLLVTMWYRSSLEQIRQEQLRASEENYRSLAENAPVIIMRINRQWEITYLNRIVESFGLEHDTVLGQPFLDIVLKRDRQLFQTKLEQLFQNIPSQTYDVHARSMTGEERIIRVDQAPVLTDGVVTEGILIGLDITAEKQAEQALAENEARYQTVVSALTEGIVVQSQTGEIIACNESAEKILGLTVDQMMGRTSIDPHWRSIHEDGTDYPGQDNPAMVTLRTGEPITGQIMGIHHPDGELRWISINSQPLFHEGATSPDAVVASYTDITESRRYLHELSQNEAMLRALLDAPTDSVTLLQADGTILAHNETALQRTPNVPEGATSLVGLNILELIVPSQRQTVIDSIEKVVSSKEVYRYQAQAGRRWFDLVMFPIFDTDDQINRVGAISREITEHKLLEYTLSQSLEQLETFFTNAVNGIAFIDFAEPIDPDQVDNLTDDEINEIFTTSTISKANPVWYSTYGRGNRELIGIQIDKTFKPSQDKIVIRRELLTRGKLSAILLQYLQGGSTRARIWVEADMACIYDIDGRIKGYFRIQRDITERKQEEEQRYERERTRILANFVQDALHEFRTPLSTILLSAHMMAKSPDPDAAEQRIERIRQQVERIQILVDDLSDISQLDSSQLTPISATYLDELVHSVYQAKREENKDRQLRFRLDLANQSGELLVNQEQIQLSFIKLMDNAIRYTPDEGEISVSTEVTDTEYIIKISDTGIGIAAEHIPHIFQRFYRVDEAHTTPGFGLGLATVKLIVEHHNGTIKVSSKLSEGSTFTVHLPFRIRESESVEPEVS